MPDFQLTDYSGQEHRLSDHEGQIVVIDFLSKDCPYSRGTAPSLAKLAKEYDGEDVVFLGIDATKGVTHEQNAAYADMMDIPYPILRDEENVYADIVGATRTPEIYIVDAEGKLRYHGAFDDRKVPDEPGETNYTKLAVDALLADAPVETAEVRAWGCTIKRVSKRDTTD
jgi:thiol-disulfide isomerase/thioredoxin